MKREKRHDCTFDYKSGLTYAQKLNRGKRSRVLLFIQDIIARLLAIVLAVVIALYIIVPMMAITVNSPIVIASVAVIVIAAFAAARVIRARAKRKKLVRALAKTEKGKVEWISKPYGKLFSVSGRTDFIFETDRSVFEVMIIPTIRKSCSIAITESADRILRIYPIPLGKIGRIIGFSSPVKAVSFGFEATGRDYGEKTLKKAIVLCPVPRDFYTAHAEGGDPGTNAEIKSVYVSGTNASGNLTAGSVMVVGGGSEPEVKNYSLRISGSGERLDGFTVENISSLLRLFESRYEYDK